MYYMGTWTLGKYRVFRVSDLEAWVSKNAVPLRVPQKGV